MQSISSIDIYFLLEELKDLINCKVDKIYQVDRTILLQFHSAKLGKILLKIIPGTAIFLTNFKQESKLTSFAIKLRKHLSQGKLIEIKQNNFERILEFKIQKKEVYYLIVELFGKGNIVLCDENYKILSCLENETWKTRTIKVNEIYKYPPQSPINLEKMSLNEFSNLVENSNKENIVKILAIDLGLGGNYAEEICFLSNVDKNKKSVTNTEIKTLFEKINSLLKEKIKPNLANTSIFPIELKHLQPKKFFSNYNEALNEYYSKIDVNQLKFEEKLNTLKEIAEKQIKQVAELENKSLEYKKVGDLIYQNFNIIENILNQIKETKWKFNDKLISEKNPKEGKITIEVN